MRKIRTSVIPAIVYAELLAGAALTPDPVRAAERRAKVARAFPLAGRRRGRKAKGQSLDRPKRYQGAWMSLNMGKCRVFRVASSASFSSAVAPIA